MNGLASFACNSSFLATLPPVFYTFFEQWVRETVQKICKSSISMDQIVFNFGDNCLVCFDFIGGLGTSLRSTTEASGKQIFSVIGEVAT
jgi:hypothetical protein